MYLSPSPRILTRDLRRKMRAEMAANQKKMLEFDMSQMKVPWSQVMLVKLTKVVSGLVELLSKLYRSTLEKCRV